MGLQVRTLCKFYVKKKKSKNQFLIEFNIESNNRFNIDIYLSILI